MPLGRYQPHAPQRDGAHRERFEAGQVVFEQGEIGRKLYLIWEGRVEVVRDGQVLATLGPGQHFGETAVFEEVRRTASIRALTTVEVVTMGRSGARTLSETLESFGEAVRMRPTGLPSDPADIDLTPAPVVVEEQEA